MAKPMFIRSAKRRFNFTMARLLFGDKSTAPHFALVGPGSANHLCQRIVESGHQRVLIVTDKPLRELGLVDQACETLIKAGIDLVWYDGVQPDPTFTQVREGAQILREQACTAILAVGGGSSMDAAKIIAATLDSSDDPESWAGINKAPETAAPLYAIPTTAGTGSEATMGAVITHEGDQSKVVISGAALLPVAVALDSNLLLALPPAITAATGLDALTHGVEAYIGIWSRGTSAETARMCVRGVAHWLPRVMAEPGDPEARLGMSMAAYYGGVAINQVNVGAVHAIAHQLGAFYHLPHGVANAMVLPHVLRVFGNSATARLEELAPLMGVSGAAPAIDAMESLRESVGLPGNSEAIKTADYEKIIERALEESDGYFSPRILTAPDVEQVLKSITA
ncbi:iron-containing alcohol dehydrogenase [Luminiphilus sp.]|nr:iron-containing alcohol dehydrogenase [Luminiphilus sp.]MDA9579765.1 iron-containing alcohol dehydrogenase [Luminiphilus sp.]